MYYIIMKGKFLILSSLIYKFNQKIAKKRLQIESSIYNLYGEAFDVKDELSISSKVTVFDLFL